MLKKTFLFFFFVLLLAWCSETKPNSSQEYDSIWKIVPQLSQLTNSGQNFSFLWSWENKNSKYGFFKWTSWIYFYDVYETNPSDVFVSKIGKKSRDSKEYVDLDEASFQIVNWSYDRENIFGMNYSKDKNFVYWRDYVLSQWSGADPQTFEIIWSCYAKDKNYVYNGQNIVEWADPFSFKQLAHLSWFTQWPVCFGADKNKIFAEWFVHFSGIQFDYDSLEFINYGRWSLKDKNALYLQWWTCESNIWCEYGIFTWFDMLSLENVEYNLWKDKNNWYQIPDNKFITLTGKFPNPQSTRHIGSFFVDEEFVYGFVFQDTTGFFVQATGVDAKTLTWLDYLYVKDSQNIYFDGKVVECTDIWSFHKVQNPQENNLLQKGLTHCNPYHKDKSSVYQDGKKIIWLDSSSFEIIPCLNPYICQCWRTKDKNWIYNNSQIKLWFLLEEIWKKKKNKYN